MSQICLNIPITQPNQTIGLEVTVDGKTRLMEYRVESVPWPASLSSEERIRQLRAFLRDYDAGWDLIQIGPPDGEFVPITFRQQSVPSAA